MSCPIAAGDNKIVFAALRRADNPAEVGLRMQVGRNAVGQPDGICTYVALGLNPF